MARRYSALGVQTTTGADKTALLLLGATTIRPRIYELVWGSAAAPADQAMLVVIARTDTAVGTASSVTPRPLDPGDPASSVTATNEFTAEPTYTAGLTLLQFPINQQATFRWQVLAEFGIVMAASASPIGLGVKTSTGTGTAKCHCTLFWEE